MKKNRLFLWAYLALTALFLVISMRASALTINHNGTTIAGTSPNLTYAKSIWKNTEAHEATFKATNAVNYLLIDDVFRAGSLVINSQLRVGQKISLYKLTGSGGNYSTQLVGSIDGPNFMLVRYISSPGEYLLEAKLTGEDYPHISIDFFPDGDGTSCNHLLPNTTLTCEQSWLPAHYRKDVEPWIRAQINQIKYRMGAVAYAKELADAKIDMIDQAFDAGIMAVSCVRSDLTPETCKQAVLGLLGKNIGDEFGNYLTQAGHENIGFAISTLTEHAVAYATAFTDLASGGAKCLWNLPDSALNCATNLVGMVELLSRDIVSILGNTVGIMDLSELEERFNETKIAWAMLESLIRDNYGKWDGLVVNAGYPSGSNPTMDQLIDAFAAKLGYSNLPLLQNKYERARVNALFLKGSMELGDWVAARRTMANPFDDADYDGIPNKQDAAPNDQNVPGMPVLTVTSPTGGKIVSAPAGIDCRTTCAKGYPTGSAVTLTATASAGYTFTGWTGACAGTGACTVTMSEAKTVTATFSSTQTGTPISGSTFIDNGDGTVTDNKTGLMWMQCADGQVWGNGACTGSATLVSNISSNWAMFAGYTDWRIPTNPELSNLISQIRNNSGNLAPLFSLATQYLTSTYSPDLPGAAYLTISQIDGSGGLMFINRTDAAVRLVRAPSVGNSFTLSVNKVAPMVSGPCPWFDPFNPDAQCQIKSEGGGSITSDSGINCGTTCTKSALSKGNYSFVATPDESSRFVGWDGACKGTSDCSVYLDANRTIVAYFAKKITQSISFTSYPKLPLLGSISAVTASADSNLIVTFKSSTPATCSVVGSSVVAIAAGTCTIAANQGGNATYSPAAEVTRSFTISKKSQSVSFTPLAGPLTVEDATALSATATSGLAVSFTAKTSSICEVNGNTLKATAGGSCVIAANQAGDSTYAAAAEATQTVTIKKRDQTIQVTTAPGELKAGKKAYMTARASSGLEVSFATATPTVCDVSQSDKETLSIKQADGSFRSVVVIGSWVNALAEGTCTLTMNQAGNSGYNTAPEVTQSVPVGTILGEVSLLGDWVGVMSWLGTPDHPLLISATATQCGYDFHDKGHQGSDGPCKVSILTNTTTQEKSLKIMLSDSTTTNYLLGTMVGPNTMVGTFVTNFPYAHSGNFQIVRTKQLPASTTTTTTTTTSSEITTTSTSTTTTNTQIPTSAIRLNPGWNLIGNSNDSPLDVIATFSDTNLFTTVWKWVAEKAQWAFYAPTLVGQQLVDYATSKGYAVLSLIAGGEGFWVNAKGEATVNAPPGTAIPGTAFAQGGKKMLNPGWNLISIGSTRSPQQFNLDLADNITPPSISEVPQIANFTTLWAWNSAQTKWYFYAPSLDAQGGTKLSDYATSKGYLDFTASGKTLGPGIGFWVNKP